VPADRSAPFAFYNAHFLLEIGRLCAGFQPLSSFRATVVYAQPEAANRTQTRSALEPGSLSDNVHLSSLLHCQKARPITFPVAHSRGAIKFVVEQFVGLRGLSWAEAEPS
jgi:hypothetical protein